MRRRYLRAALRSVGLYALTMVAVVVVVFALPRAMPGDPLSSLDDPDNSVYVTDPLVRDKVRAYYGLDEPLPQQFEHYVGRLARGDLGFSIARKRPVVSLLRAHLPWTLLLMGVSIVLASLLSFVAGVAATWLRGGAPPRPVAAARHDGGAGHTGVRPGPHPPHRLRCRPADLSPGRRPHGLRRTRPDRRRARRRRPPRAARRRPHPVVARYEVPVGPQHHDLRP